MTDKSETPETDAVIAEKCGPIVEAAKLEELSRRLERQRNAAMGCVGALREVMLNRDWCIKAGGAEGPLPQDVIQKFAEMQLRTTDQAATALAAFDAAMKGEGAERIQDSAFENYQEG